MSRRKGFFARLKAWLSIAVVLVVALGATGYAILANLDAVLQADETNTTRENDDEAREAIEDALLGAKHIQRVVRDLKTYSRASVERLEPVDVQSVAVNVLKMLENETRHRAKVVCQFEDGGSVAIADEGRLGQILLNLVLNAAQAIPEGHAHENTITVSTKSVGNAS